MTVVAIVLTLFFVVYGTVVAFSGHDYRVRKEVVPFSGPPRYRFAVYGKWPNNLICYGFFLSQEEAEEWAVKASAR
ncbi:hypothetical protein [Bosea minatitlanensis]|uniref:SPOR domain-containing protein n=1 Tax=Bosea minatitlanensis TaxID=128782 RepID=A0ABW0EZW7_9HYPH|nr:hypothetical protein [Bosea minatitlanensis]MCT4492727.1 hypothetical protein [Bosea minatitlanensis]